MNWRRLPLAVTAVLAFGLALPGSASAGLGIGLTAPFYGDVTGNHFPDKVQVGSDSNGCIVAVSPGLAQGHFGAPVVHRYTVPGTVDPVFAGRWGGLCPAKGVAASTGKPNAKDDIVLTWAFDVFGYLPPYAPNGPSNTHFILTMRDWNVIASSVGEFEPSKLGAVDLNGDGQQDLWEDTDQGDGFQTFLRSGDGFVRGPAVAKDNGTASETVRFGQLDREPGEEIVLPYNDGKVSTHGTGHGVAVISGLTGARQDLVRDPDGFFLYHAEIKKLDHHRGLDIEVTWNSWLDGPHSLSFYNDGFGHFTDAAGNSTEIIPPPSG